MGTPAVRTKREETYIKKMERERERDEVSKNTNIIGYNHNSKTNIIKLLSEQKLSDDTSYACN